MTDQDFIRIAIDESRKCVPEDERVHPRVGVVVAKDGELLSKAFRGRDEAGQHAEYTALEIDLPKKTLAGSTIYTTLEPCTTRNRPKVPCANRIAERKIARVVIGMLDPNPQITGKGVAYLRDSGIDVELFPAHLMAEVEEINRDFSRTQKLEYAGPDIDEDFIRERRSRSLDTWYLRLNNIYWNHNYYRSAAEIFSHYVEVIGGLSSLASDKVKKNVEPQAYIAKTLAWWLALAGKLGVTSVEDLLWDKFPNVCPYCKQPKCLGGPCQIAKKELPGPDWDALSTIADQNRNDRPQRLSEWQAMFQRIYPASPGENFGHSFARLMEEIGELSEAVRVFSSEPGYFLSEAADVFAWTMHVQNIMEMKSESTEWGIAIERAMVTSYPDRCLECHKAMCSCPPILDSTIGRIAHEVPASRGTYKPDGRFMTPDKACKRFKEIA